MIFSVAFVKFVLTFYGALIEIIIGRLKKSDSHQRKGSVLQPWHFLFRVLHYGSCGFQKKKSCRDPINIQRKELNLAETCAVLGGRADL